MLGMQRIIRKSCRKILKHLSVSLDLKSRDMHKKNLSVLSVRKVILAQSVYLHVQCLD